MLQLARLDGFPFRFPFPLTFSPPSCHDGMAKKLVEDSGGTYTPAQASLAHSETMVVAGAPSTGPHAFSMVVLAAVSWLLAVMVM